MQKLTKKIVLFPTLIVHLLLLSWMPAAQAASVGTGSFIEIRQQATILSEVQTALTQQAVRQQLLALGVDPDEAGARIAALTTGELKKIAQSLNELPAGAGVFEVIGIVFLVLLILELVGITDIFKKL